MTVKEAQKIIENVRYRGGLRVFLSEENEAIKMAIRDTRLDAFESGMLFPITSIHIFPTWALANMEEKDLVRLIFNNICKMETHEAGEWFRFKGKTIFNPHSET